MRAKKTRFDEIAAEIVHLLVSKGDTDATEVVVRSSIQFLKELAQGKPLWSFKKSNTDALSAFLTNIGDLRQTLSAMPGELLILLAVKNVSEQVPSLSEQLDARERLEKIVAMRIYLQTRCDIS